MLYVMLPARFGLLYDNDYMAPPVPYTHSQAGTTVQSAVRSGLLYHKAGGVQLIRYETNTVYCKPYSNYDIKVVVSS